MGQSGPDAQRESVPLAAQRMLVEVPSEVAHHACSEGEEEEENGEVGGTCPLSEVRWGEVVPGYGEEERRPARRCEESTRPERVEGRGGRATMVRVTRRTAFAGEGDLRWSRLAACTTTSET